MNEKVEKLKAQSLAIRSFPIKEESNVVDAIFMEDHDEVKLFESNITEYLKPYCDLSKFEYLYPINAITEGLNYWVWDEKRRRETNNKRKASKGFMAFVSTAPIIFR